MKKKYEINLKSEVWAFGRLFPEGLQEVTKEEYKVLKAYE